MTPLGMTSVAARDADGILPHVLTSLGLEEHSATAQTRHLLAAGVQFLTEMIIDEVDAPEITRPRDHDLYDVPLLRVRIASSPAAYAPFGDLQRLNSVLAKLHDRDRAGRAPLVAGTSRLQAQRSSAARSGCQQHDAHECCG
jgi:hypothetical protein